MADVLHLNTNSVATAELDYWRPYIWARKVYEEAKTQMYWNRFSGPEGSGMPVVVKRELISNPGQLINISQIANLTAAGRSGEQVLRGYEEKLSLAQVQLTPEWYRHAIADTVKVEKQINHDFRTKAANALAYWMAKKMDTSMWTAARVTAAAGFEAAAVPTIYANNATSNDTIDAADDFGVAEIRKAAAVLEGLDQTRLRVPGMPAGEGYYLCFIHPYQAYSLKGDSDWISNMQNAYERGRDNPLFTGALGEIDGVIVHATTQATRAVNANSPAVYTSRAVVMGQEALARGMNEDVVWTEQMDDYQFEKGIGIRAAWQDKILSSKALVHIVSACVNPDGSD